MARVDTVTNTPEQINAEFERLLGKASLRPREPRNDGLSVAQFTEALRQSATPERTAAIRDRLDKIKLKL
jgi:hypothetical protein